MQWYQHTRPAQMQMVIDDCLDENPLAQHEDDEGVLKEKYRCAACAGETFWVIYDPRNPVAGCMNSECSVDSRMGILDVLEHQSPQDYLHQLPEGGNERRKALQKTLNQISARHLAEEERRRQEELQAERRRFEGVREDRDRWKHTAQGWQAEAHRQQDRAADLVASLKDAKARLHEQVDRQAVRRGIGWGATAFLVAVVALVAFVRQARAELFFGWGPAEAMLYAFVVAGVLGFVAFAVSYRDTMRAKRSGRRPVPLYERVDLWTGVRWAGKLIAFGILPYVIVGAIGGTGLVMSLLPPDGVERLLLATGAAMLSLLGTSASMAGDLVPEESK